MSFYSLEPFVILPYKDKQDILFYSGDLIRNNFPRLKDIIYSELPNNIIKDNLIKVVVKFNYIIIFHIYPTNFKEKCSGRGGQNLIIGYYIYKKELIRNFETIIFRIEFFFETVKKCVNECGDVPTNFLQNVNYGDELAIIERLENCRKEISKSLSENGCYLKCFKNRKKKFLHTNWIEKYNEVQIDSRDRLQYVYKYIVKHCITNKEFWILVNCKEVSYYNLKNIHVINFVEKSNLKKTVSN